MCLANSPGGALGANKISALVLALVGYPPRLAVAAPPHVFLSSSGITLMIP